MKLRNKIILLALAPLPIALLLVAATLRHQESALAISQRQLIHDSFIGQRQSELRSYMALALSMVRPLYDSGRDDEALRLQALQRLRELDYGSDGYFFVYDLQGRVLMHSRQPELVDQNLWALRDSRGRATIQDLTARAAAGGGFVEYEWRKPSSALLAPKLGFVTTLPRWGWMVGTGLYLDDIEATLSQLDRQLGQSRATTLQWIAVIAAGCLAAVTLAGLMLNLSEHRDAESKLRRLARQVVQSQEDERGRLARELHDGTSQNLVSAKLLIETAVASLDRDRIPAPPALGRALQRLNETLVEVRRLSHRLRPALLDTLGLPAALERLAAESGDEGGVAVALSVGGVPRELTPDVKTALFRVTQEALTNAHKHAGASRVQIRLAFREAGVRLEVADDGQGFDPIAVHRDPDGGIGLRNMRERVASIGGQFRVESTPPGGTRIVADLPLDRQVPA